MLTGKLLAIVSVDPAKRVQCQNPGCGHGVYAAIHVVEKIAASWSKTRLN